jgi:NAD(P)-dependent dehydrogenase (short-subunit alcohol dehydrogenase family)
MHRLDGRKALVTGAGSGIGRAIAIALAKAGAAVAVTDIDAARADGVADEIGAPAFGLRLDVTKAAEVEDAFTQAAARLGGLDLVCANAGVITMNLTVDLTEQEWDFNMAVNAKGVFLTNRQAVRMFLAAGVTGAIVNTASVAGKTPWPFLAHYCASKFAVVGFTQALAREVAPQGIRVNAVGPGIGRTRMLEGEVEWAVKVRGRTPEDVYAEWLRQVPLGRLEEPEDVAEVVVFLAGDGARYMTGISVDVNGGMYMS